jgi:arabinogalactan oligomer / maltooligosaccharide transport system substrate-binding protein
MFLLFGCQPHSKPQTKLNIWMDSNEKEMLFFKSVAHLFETRNPQIKVNLRFMPFADLKPRYSGEAMEPEGPDLVYLMNDWIGELAEKKLLQPLQRKGSDNLSFSYSGMRYQGEIYALPFVFQVVALIRNTDWISTAPTHWIETKTKAPYTLMYDNRNFYFHVIWLHAFGGQLFDAQGHLALRKEPLLASIRYALALEKKGLVPPKSSSSATLNLFSAGKAAYMVSGPWSLAAPKQNGINLAVSSLPPIDSKHVPKPFIGIKGFGLNPSSKSLQAAQNWLDFVSQTEIQEKALKELDNLPVLASIYKDKSVSEIKYNFFKQAQLGVPMPNSPLMKALWQEMNWLLNQAFDHPNELNTYLDQALKRLYQEESKNAHPAA